MPSFAKFVDFAGTKVPQGKDGRYYDWKTSTKTDLVELHSPYGRRHFTLGGMQKFAVLDYALMPDQRIVLMAPYSVYDMILDPRDYLHQEDHYNLLDGNEATQAAYWLVEKILNHLSKHGIEHHSQWHNGDALFIVRAIGSSLNLAPFNQMNEQQLRFGVAN